MPMPEPSPAQAAAQQLQALLAAVEAGDLDASSTMQAGLVGGLAALDAEPRND